MHTRGNQLLPELLLTLSDTLHIQYRYNKHVHEEVSCQKDFYFFLQSDCISNLAILFDFCIFDISFGYIMEVAIDNRLSIVKSLLTTGCQSLLTTGK